MHIAMDDIKLDHQERVSQARQWLASCGLRYHPQGQRPQSSRELTEQDVDALVARLAYDGDRSALTYYQCWAVMELPSDRQLVANVCPLFVLHSIARMLAQGATEESAVVSDSANREWLLALHCLKVRLSTGGAVLGFLVRLMDLVYQNYVMTPARPECPALRNVVAVFLCNSLSFMNAAPSDGADAPHRYTYRAISHQHALEELIAWRMYRDAEPAHLEAVHMLASRLRTLTLDDWGTHQQSRLTGQLKPLSCVVIKESRYLDEMTVERVSL